MIVSVTFHDSVVQDPLTGKRPGTWKEDRHK